MKVFRVDIKNQKELLLLPRIPNNLSDNEDNTTKRICCSPSLNGCLSSVDNLDYHDILYVYEAEAEIYQPSEFQVYDAYLTGEMWILETTLFKKIGELIITGYIGQDSKKGVNNQYAFKFTQSIKEDIDG